MDKHTHYSCGHLYDCKSKPNLTLRWLASIFFVVLILILARPFITKQLLSRASSYMTCELFNDAIRSYEKAVSIDKKNVKAWNMLGYAYKVNGNPEKSLYAYQQAVKADPNDKNAIFSVGAVLVSEKKYKEAIPYFEQVVALGPEQNGQAIDIVSYHKSSLELLIGCYGALNEFDKRDSIREKFRRYYPEDNAVSNKGKSGRLLEQ